jgi:hypothetical protein
MKLPFLLLGLLGFVEVTPINAQAPRQGAWLDFGLGYGSASFHCDTCTTTQTLGGWSMSGGIGGTLNPHIRLGAGFRVWLNGLKAGKPLPGISTGTLLLSYYPRTRGSPFVELGGGLSYYELCRGKGDPIEPCSNGSTYASGTGWGYTLGTGWEIPIGDNGMFRPLLTYHHGAVGRLHSPDGTTVVTGWKQNLLTVELTLLAH